MLLFHAMEYPPLTKQFPVNLGYCQANSSLAFNASAFPFRNALWVLPLDAPAEAALWLLDARRPSLVWTDVLSPWARPVFVVEEERLGTPVADVFLLDSTPLCFYSRDKTAGPEPDRQSRVAGRQGSRAVPAQGNRKRLC